ncbi:MAG: ABC transporter ATP-binding protein/permease [Lachnospiraceae bacterium]|nr:ABC transporter ATP-binding protein/permease [Lachnospiraceae bacterium]
MKIGICDDEKSTRGYLEKLLKEWGQEHGMPVETVGFVDAERFEELPQGLDTFVGKEFDESGVNFSGGERQKMAIARAIYKAGAFVIMDEPTAALDPVSECEVYAGFDKMVGRKTAFYISHRLASCRFCQDILVFDEGKVVQRGSHEELWEGLFVSSPIHLICQGSCSKTTLHCFL